MDGDPPDEASYQELDDELNDETFGDTGPLNEEWQQSHQQLAQLASSYLSGSFGFGAKNNNAFNDDDAIPTDQFVSFQDFLDDDEPRGKSNAAGTSGVGRITGSSPFSDAVWGSPALQASGSNEWTSSDAVRRLSVDRQQQQQMQQQMQMQGMFGGQQGNNNNNNSNNNSMLPALQQLLQLQNMPPHQQQQFLLQQQMQQRQMQMQQQQQQQQQMQMQMQGGGVPAPRRQGMISVEELERNARMNQMPPQQQQQQQQLFSPNDFLGGPQQGQQRFAPQQGQHPHQQQQHHQQQHHQQHQQNQQQGRQMMPPYPQQNQQQQKNFQSPGKPPLPNQQHQYQPHPQQQQQGNQQQQQNSQQAAMAMLEKFGLTMPRQQGQPQGGPPQQQQQQQQQGPPPQHVQQSPQQGQQSQPFKSVFGIQSPSQQQQQQQQQPYGNRAPYAQRSPQNAPATSSSDFPPLSLAQQQTPQQSVPHYLQQQPQAQFQNQFQNQYRGGRGGFGGNNNRDHYGGGGFQHQGGYQQFGYRPQRWDCMTKREVDMVMRFYQSHVSILDPYVEDFYYHAVLASQSEKIEKNYNYHKAIRAIRHQAAVEALVNNNGAGTPKKDDDASSSTPSKASLIEQRLEGALGRPPLHGIRTPKPVVIFQRPASEGGAKEVLHVDVNSSAHIPTKVNYNTLRKAIEESWSGLLDMEDLQLTLSNKELSEKIDVANKLDLISNEMFSALGVFVAEYGFVPSEESIAAQRAGSAVTLGCRYPQDEFFVQLCLVPKGRRLIGRALPLFSKEPAGAITAVVMRNLSFIVTVFAKEARAANPGAVAGDAELQSMRQFIADLQHAFVLFDLASLTLGLAWLTGDDANVNAVLSYTSVFPLLQSLFSRANAIIAQGLGQEGASEAGQDGDFSEETRKVWDGVLAVFVHKIVTCHARIDNKTISTQIIIDLMSKCVLGNMYRDLYRKLAAVCAAAE